jgi:hypothetical protein
LYRHTPGWITNDLHKAVETSTRSTRRGRLMCSAIFVFVSKRYKGRDYEETVDGLFHQRTTRYHSYESVPTPNGFPIVFTLLDVLFKLKFCEAIKKPKPKTDVM